MNTDDDLRQFATDSFDLVYSWIVLQHLPPRIATRYISEFARVIRPGGLACFQLPSRLRSRSSWSNAGYHVNMLVRRKLFRDPAIFEMYGVPRDVVEREIVQAGARLLETRLDAGAGPEWEGFLYAVTK